MDLPDLLVLVDDSNIEFFEKYIEANDIEDEYDLFHAAAKKHQYKFIKSIIAEKLITPRELLTISCSQGYFETVKWLMTTYNYFGIGLINEAFMYCCEEGHLEIAKWLISKRPDIDIRPNASTLFYTCCTRDKLEAAKWLIYFFPRIKFLSLRHKTSFSFNCVRGQLKMAQWLISVRPDINVHANDDHAFRYSCKNGHLEVAKWLMAICPDIKIRTRNDFAFRKSFMNNNFKVTKWLATLCDNYVFYEDDVSASYEIKN